MLLYSSIFIILLEKEPYKHSHHPIGKKGCTAKINYYCNYCKQHHRQKQSRQKTYGRSCEKHHYRKEDKEYAKKKHAQYATAHKTTGKMREVVDKAELTTVGTLSDILLQIFGESINILT